MDGAPVWWPERTTSLYPHSGWADPAGGNGDFPHPPTLIPSPTLGPVLTFGDDALQADDVVVAELAHDAGLTEEVYPLLLRVAGFQRLDGHGHLLLPRSLQRSLIHLPKLSCGNTRRESAWPWGAANWPQAPSRGAALTCSNDLLPRDTGGMDLGGELEHRLVGVLVRVGVHIGL